MTKMTVTKFQVTTTEVSHGTYGGVEVSTITTMQAVFGSHEEAENWARGRMGSPAYVITKIRTAG